MLNPIMALASSGSTIAGAVSSSDLNGVLTEIIALLPVVIPVVIGYIGLRKGIKFLFSTLRSA